MPEIYSLRIGREWLPRHLQPLRALAPECPRITVNAFAARDWTSRATGWILERMRFDDYMNEVLNSSKHDWNVMTCWGFGSGPSYREQFEVAQRMTPSRDLLSTIDVKSHSMSAALRSNLAITIAWGLTSNEDFIEPWANSFPNPKASSSYVDFFYAGSMIYRDIYVTVDGGRVRLPLPDDRDGKLVAPSSYVELCRLLMSFEGAFDQLLDNYISRDRPTNGLRRG